MPTEAGIAGSASRPRLWSRMYARIAASVRSTRSTGAVSPAVNNPARYSIGMRRAEIAPNRLSTFSPSCASRLIASTTGESGGTYQTIGMVRYSGCSGNATRYCLISAYTGERRADSNHSSVIPFSRAPATTAGSNGSSSRSSWAWYRSCSRSVDAASSTLSASYSSRPRYRSRPTQVSEHTVGRPTSIRG